VNRLEISWDKQTRSVCTMAEVEATAADRNVEIWKIKKLIKSLEAARGSVLLLFAALCVAQLGNCNSKLDSSSSWLCLGYI